MSISKYTCPVHHRVWKNQEEYINDYKITTCPTSKTMCQGDRTSEIYVPCST